MRTLAILFLVLAASATTLAQGFGQNKVQYETFDWRYLQSEHFDVYFAKGSEKVAEFCAETAEAALKQLEQSWDYTLEGRITIISYRSHNKFQQTNVTTQLPEESVGGFTEFLKNRVVIPFSGNYEAFRHVIHHELAHAVNLRMFYGTGFQSILIGATTSNVPLWFSEGLAEYEARGGWDVEADMFMRDATIAGYLPDINELGGYFAYKGGQSVFYYLDRKYGAGKVGEFVNKVKNTRDVERALRSAVGLEMEDFNRQWQNWLRSIYWPSVADLKAPEDFAERLTDHEKWRNFVNNGPAVSPDGDKLAFLSDRSDYFDVWLMDLTSQKLRRILKGERSGGFEELKWLDARISWSPDGKSIAFASKAGKTDAVNILDVRRKRVTQRLRFDFDGIFNPTWSPDGRKIAFVGMKNGQSDLFYYDFEAKSLQPVTKDVFSDDDPSWSTDSESLFFVSDRQDSLRVTGYDPPLSIWKLDYHQTDVYRLRLGDLSAERLTTTPTNERTPIGSSDGRFLVYAADVNGIYNLYRRDLETGAEEAITNCLTGCLQPSVSLHTQRLVFSSLSKGGYDIFMLTNVADLPALPLRSTNFRRHGSPEPRAKVVTADSSASPAYETRDRARPYAHYVFAQTGGLDESKPLAEKLLSDTVTTRHPGGGFFSKKYRVKFTPDFVYATAAYSSFFGAQGTGQILFSDVMGNQVFFVNTDLYYDFNNLDNSNFSVQYFYLPRRINYGVGVFRYVYYLDAGHVRDRTWQLALDLAYPFSKYSRTELMLGGYFIDRARWSDDSRNYQSASKRRVLLPELGYVHDTVLWGSTGPTYGSRYRFAAAYSPMLGENPSPDDAAYAEFYTLTGDVRNYYRLGREYTWAARLTVGVSGGPNRQRFFLGGVSNWINRRFENDSIPTERIDDFYFSSFITPFRGGDYFEQRGTGNRYFLTNQEFRFPTVRYLQLGWPLPLAIRDIRGALFTDVGAAWFDDKFKFSTVDPNGVRRLADVQAAYGLGLRSWLGLFVLRWDVAWATDGVSTSKPRYYMSIGAEY